MNAIFKHEKGSLALKKLQTPLNNGRARILGGSKLSKNSKLIRKGGDIKRIVEKISKFTPGQCNSTAAKRSAQRLSGKTPTIPSPGGGSHVGTTNHQTMEDFKRMVAYLNKKYKGTSRGGGSNQSLNGGKLSGGKKSGKLSTKLQKSTGKKSQK